MKIGLISDTHSYLDENVFIHFKDCDEIWHAGDIGNINLLNSLQNFKTTRAVYGNIDGLEFRNDTEENLHFNCAGLSVWMTHIGGYPPRYVPKILTQLKQKTPDIFICGHSHILRVLHDKQFEKPLLYINPGAAGKHGFHQVRTILRFEINNSKVENMQAIELGKRA